MGKADDDPGFNKVWRDLDRALSMPVFNKHEVALMQVARELSYTSSVIDGTGRAKPFRFHAGLLAKHRGLTRENTSRAITRLLEDGVLLGNRDRLRINKAYRTWTGDHALSDAQIAECDSARTDPVTECGEVLSHDRTTSVKATENHRPECDYFVTPVTKKSHGMNVQCDEIVTPSEPVQSVTKKSHEGAKSVTISSQTTDEGVTKKSHQCDEIVTLSASPLTTPLLGREQSNSSSPLPPIGGDDDEPFAPPIQDSRPSEPSPNATAIDELVEWCRGVLGTRFAIEDFGPKVSGWVMARFDPAWIRDAVLCSLSTAAPGKLAQYTNKCLLNWQRNGRPESKQSPGAKNQPADPALEFRVSHVPPEQQPFIDALYRPKKPKGARR